MPHVGDNAEHLPVPGDACSGQTNTGSAVAHPDLAPLRKQNEGFDVSQLFVGTEGKYGVATAVAFEPASRAAAWLAIPDPRYSRACVTGGR
jgi:hypothetical protein